MTNRFPRWLALGNVVFAVLGVSAACSVYSELTTRDMVNSGESVALSLRDSPHPALAVGVLAAAIAIAALLVAAALGGWRDRAWARIATLGWCGLVFAAQVFAIAVRDDGYGWAYDIVSRVFPVITVYGLVTLFALYGNRRSITRVAPASPRA